MKNTQQVSSSKEIKTTEQLSKVWIGHNQYGYANAEAISERGNKIFFPMHKVTEPLKSKIYGFIGVIELSCKEMEEIFNLKVNPVCKAGEVEFKNVFSTK